jgi:hypothetical protein
MEQCPDRDLLERLLNDRLADTEFDELDRHLKGCASRQQTLEQLTDDPVWGTELRHELSLAFADTDLGRTVDRPGVMAGETTAADDRTETISRQTIIPREPASPRWAGSDRSSLHEQASATLLTHQTTASSRPDRS